MGLFSVPVAISPAAINAAGISAAASRPSETMAALVDTGATHSMFPADRLARLSIHPERELPVRLADNSIITFGRGRAVLAVMGRRATVPVLFLPPGGGAILGASALQAFGMAVDPVQHRLIPDLPQPVR